MKALWSGRSARERTLIVLCLAVVVVALYLVLTPPPSAAQKLISPERARAAFEQTVRDKQTLDDEILQMTPRIGRAAYQEAPERLLPRVVRTLQGYARDSGIHLREIKPLRTRRIGDVTRLPVSVRYVGAFAKSIPFLYRIEDPNGRLVVEKLTVAAPDPKSRQVDVEVQVALYTLAGSTDQKGEQGTP